MRTDRIYPSHGLISQNGGNEVRKFISDFKPNGEEIKQLLNVALKIRLLTRSHGVNLTKIAFLSSDSTGRQNFRNSHHNSFYISERMTEERAILFFDNVVSNYYILIGELEDV